MYYYAECAMSTYHECVRYNIIWILLQSTIHNPQSTLAIRFGFVVHKYIIANGAVPLFCHIIFAYFMFKHQIHITNVTYKCYSIHISNLHTKIRFYITNIQYINTYRKLRMYWMPDARCVSINHSAYI